MDLAELIEDQKNMTYEIILQQIALADEIGEDAVEPLLAVATRVLTDLAREEILLRYSEVVGKEGEVRLRQLFRKIEMAGVVFLEKVAGLLTIEDQWNPEYGAEARTTVLSVETLEQMLNETADRLLNRHT